MPLNLIPLHIRGGSILPLQYEAQNTLQSRRNYWILFVALDEAQTAKGELYWDDGVSIIDERFNRVDFEAFNGTVIGTPRYSRFQAENESIHRVEILGLIQGLKIQSVIFNGVQVQRFMTDESNGRLSIITEYEHNANMFSHSFRIEYFYQT